ncbi:hypothetical protein T484DRAFT_1793295 [Baffinella frigidus]|nr:hypothetical protein T484DRAFT_1793295 [Cryptophyta sp. CCMP2293]
MSGYPKGPAVTAELVDTVLDAWQMLGFKTRFPSTPIGIRMQGFGPGLCFTGGCTTSVEDWNAQFVKDLKYILGARFEGIIDIDIIQGPVSCPLYNPRFPTILGQLTGGDCPLTLCTELMRCPSPWTNPATDALQVLDCKDEECTNAPLSEQDAGGVTPNVTAIRTAELDRRDQIFAKCPPFP